MERPSFFVSGESRCTTPPMSGSGKIFDGDNGSDAKRPRLSLKEEPDAPSEQPEDNEGCSSLAQELLRLVDRKHGDEGVNIDDATAELGVDRRRLLVLTDVLEGAGVLEHGRTLRRRGYEADEATLDSSLAAAEIARNAFCAKAAAHLRIPVGDLRRCPGMADGLLLAIKAPPATTLQVPDDPGCVTVNGSPRRYQLRLSHEKQPVEVMILADRQQEQGARPPPASLPTTPRRNHSSQQLMMLSSPNREETEFNFSVEDTQIWASSSPAKVIDDNHHNLQDNMLPKLQMGPPPGVPR